MPTEQDLIAAYQRGWNDAMMGRASAATVAEPRVDERAACDAAYERWTASPDFRQYNKPGFDAGYRAAQSSQRAGAYPTLRLCRQDRQASDVFIHAVRRDEATGAFDVLVSTSEERNG